MFMLYPQIHSKKNKIFFMYEIYDSNKKNSLVNSDITNYSYLIWNACISNNTHVTKNLNTKNMKWLLIFIISLQVHSVGTKDINLHSWEILGQQNWSDCLLAASFRYREDAVYYQKSTSTYKSGGFCLTCIIICKYLLKAEIEVTIKWFLPKKELFVQDDINFLFCEL